MVRLISEVRANVAMIAALSLVPIIAAIGLAIDFERWSGERQHVQASLDAAALAAAKGLYDSRLTSHDIEQVARASFVRNISGAGEELNCRTAEGASSLSVLVEFDAREVEVSIQCELRTVLMGMLDHSRVEIAAAATAKAEIPSLDLALMLDTSGGMGVSSAKWGTSETRIDSLKRIVADTVDRLITEASGNRVRIALIPYNSYVNVSGLEDRVIENWSADKTRDIDTNGNMRVDRHETVCSFRRQGPEAFTNVPPGPGAKFPYVPVKDEYHWGPFGTKTLIRRIPRCTVAPILPLTSNKAELLNALRDLPTRDSTAGHLGIAWSWYLTSPEWRHVLPAGSKPLPSSETNALRAIILMTDGDFNQLQSTAKYVGGVRNHTTPFKATKKTCLNIAETDTIVFAIRLTEDATLTHSDLILRNFCASQPEYFFVATDGAQLQAAYSEIASVLIKLRLSQ